ncbi:hypothetical protein LPJ81_002462 [Coemansia sp. IMI 209127]|nr:hypothetical protein LPJ81_002462 [Coemansia sp. IMI 209127]
MLLAFADAHTQVFNAGTNGVYGSNFQYEIENDYGNKPVKDLTTNDLRCRSNNTITGDGVDKLTVNAGDKIDIRWRHANDSVSVAVMSLSHVGPCMVYMAPLISQGEGPVWFKIYEDGWCTDAKKWCTIKLIDNNGYLEVTIPENIPSGDYLVRPELLALHQATIVGGAQFYPNCLVVTVTGGTTSTMPFGYSIPGIYSPQDPGILYNRKDDPTTYVIPGPPIFTQDNSQNESSTSSNEEMQSSSASSAFSSSASSAFSSSASSAYSSSASAASTPTSTSVAPPVNLTPTSSVSKCRPRPTSSKCMKGSGSVARRMAKRKVQPSPTPEQQQRAEL